MNIPTRVFGLLPVVATAASHLYLRTDQSFSDSHCQRHCSAGGPGQGCCKARLRTRLTAPMGRRRRTCEAFQPTVTTMVIHTCHSFTTTQSFGRALFRPFSRRNQRQRQRHRHHRHPRHHRRPRLCALSCRVSTFSTTAACFKVDRRRLRRCVRSLITPWVLRQGACRCSCGSLVSALFKHMLKYAPSLELHGVLTTHL